MRFQEPPGAVTTVVSLLPCAQAPQKVTSKEMKSAFCVLPK